MMFSQALTSVVLKPSEVKSWSITHTSTQYELKPGRHIIQGEVVGYGGANTTIFVDTPQNGEEKFVVGLHPLEGRDDLMFVVSITDPETIEQARACYFYSRQNPSDPRCGKHISGVIGSGDGGFNQNWNWHLAPETVTLVENSIELCDGTTGDVERDGADFAGGTFCPWSSYILALGDQYPILTSATVQTVQEGTLSQTNVSVIVDALNVRREATLNASKTGLVRQGEVLKKLEEKNGWIKVELPSGQAGWVYGEFVR